MVVSGMDISPAKSTHSKRHLSSPPSTLNFSGARHVCWRPGIGTLTTKGIHGRLHRCPEHPSHSPTSPAASRGSDGKTDVDCHRHSPSPNPCHHPNRTICLLFASFTSSLVEHMAHCPQGKSWPCQRPPRCLPRPHPGPLPKPNPPGCIGIAFGLWQ